jgi:type III restriction enzyme
MIRLKDYQSKAVANLKDKMKKTLKHNENSIIIFQSPTGSGKTLMVSEAIKAIVRADATSVKLSFVWVSVRMLHEQSKEKLEKYYEDERSIRCSYFHDLEDKMIKENEILFLNWHSINKKDINILVKESEENNNLSTIIYNTKKAGRDIILIIDESHHTAKSEKSKELIEAISPKLTLEVSATPHLTDKVAEIEKIYLSDVKAEEMIKSEIVINPEFKNLKISNKSTDEIVIEQALLKREEIAKIHTKLGTNINPLLLIQLPDKKADLDDKKEDVIKILHKLKVKDEEIAIWLSEDKTETLANIDKNDNEVKVLIFKQAIALGWDCPRATLLVIFRETKSFVFTIQTIGRIMRMPEFKYYKIDDLNKGYIYTNLSDIEITEDYAKDYITVYESKRDNKLYKDIQLPSVYIKRQRERTRLAGQFVNIFSQIAKKVELEKKLNVNPKNISNSIMSDGKIVDIDKIGIINHNGSLDIKIDEQQLQDLFDRFIYDACTPYAPADSSDRMKTAIYNFLKKEFSIDKFDSKAQIIVLGDENRQYFIDAINQAKELYESEVVKKLSEKREKEDIDDWQVPLVVSYNSKYSLDEKKISVLKPFFKHEQSDPEKEFIKSLEDSKNVKWWFKNGDSESKYFAVERPDGNAFYPDFIVQFKDGTLGIYDTKSGFTAKDAKERAEGLYSYIQKQKKKGNKLTGGIVITKDGSWRLNNNKEYNYDPSNIEDWKVLEI